MPGPGGSSLSLRVAIRETGCGRSSAGLHLHAEGPDPVDYITPAARPPVAELDPAVEAPEAPRTRHDLAAGGDPDPGKSGEDDLGRARRRDTHPIGDGGLALAPARPVQDEPVAVAQLVDRTGR